MGSISQGQRLKTRDVAIIGAGPSGLAMAKYLLAEGAFSRVVIYEQRGTVGGIWNHTPLPAGKPPRSAVPQIDPHAKYEELLTPLYDRLEVNIPKQMMGYSDHKWPSDVQLFPTHAQTLNYLKGYSKDIQHLIRFNTTVVDVKQLDGVKWDVETRNTNVQASEISGQTSIETFDAVCVASGHFHVPYIPSVPGIELFDCDHPGVVTHAKYFRAPESFTDKKVVVVGNSASGIDIGNQASEYAQLPVIYSQRSESFLEPGASPDRREKPAIVEFITDRRAVRFSDGSEEADVDAVVYCTGYFYAFPFLKSLQNDPQPLITSGEFVNGLYQHIFLHTAPSLAFLCLNQRIIPFQAAEAQAAVVAAVWSGRLNLPSDKDMQDWLAQLVEASQQAAAEEGRPEEWGRKVHVLGNLRDADYINLLHDWAASAEQPLMKAREVSTDGNDDEKKIFSKEPPYWGEREYWLRARVPAVKKAFAACGRDRNEVRTIEELGFDYEAWKREQPQDGAK
ncbi:FAD/NAD(P)-binding domain-containing protein [Polychaeton citri CBS 116435]|uniref:FAD/NAD(P)-binding domain-containing protein n=1 Tax=Polychaeton citri CBS 116435 TaxID=1314669 RepID=A0A9P4Q6I9_9PEZI|nr:FAD/NAD(P)-binding domain-containing protein [Polychaeton citri CBS 116435]